MSQLNFKKKGGSAILLWRNVIEAMKTDALLDIERGSRVRWDKKRHVPDFGSTRKRKSSSPFEHTKPLSSEHPREATVITIPLSLSLARGKA